MKKGIRNGLSILIILLTVAEFSYYLSHHSYLLRQLEHTSPLIILWLLLLYGVVFFALFLILEASLRICRVVIGPGENLLINAYSILVNFFIIGQAGPGFRAVYLKRNYALLIRKYIFVTLIYYACYSVLAILLLFVGSSLPWWITVLIGLAMCAVGIAAIRLHASRTKVVNDKLKLSLLTISYLFLATVLQVFLQIVIYLIELHAVRAHASLKQTLAYTGVANLALFVGLTPGAIGIRESFLVFSERLHHISSANIVSANIIDRSVYILFLGILFVIIITFHAQKRLSIKDTLSPAKTE